MLAMRAGIRHYCCAPCLPALANVVLAQLWIASVSAGPTSTQGKSSKESGKDDSFKFEDLKFNDTDVQ